MAARRRPREGLGGTPGRGLISTARPAVAGGVLRAGSYGTGAERDFWLVRGAEQVLVIELAPGAPYRRIVLQVPDANAEAVRLRPQVGAYTGVFTDR